MLKINSVQVKLYLEYGEKPEALTKPGAEWLRKAVSRVLAYKNNNINMAAFDRSLFFNENPETGKGKNSYPLVLFHHQGTSFNLLGINEGAAMLDLMFRDTNGYVYLDRKSAFRFELKTTQIHELSIAAKNSEYLLMNWIPFKPDDYRDKIEKCHGIKQRIENLEERIRLQIQKDLANHFNLSIDGFSVNILEPGEPGGISVSYEEHGYKAFTILFESNLILPEGIALGHGKAFGFGIIHRMNNL